MFQGGGTRKVIGIEPGLSFEFLENYIERFSDICDVELHHIGCWNKRDELIFQSEGETSRVVHEGNSRIIVDKLDNIVSPTESVSFINIGLSVGGAEILEGAKNIITKSKPTIVVYMGVARDEWFTVPKLLKDIYHDYKLYVRFLTCIPNRCFLFAKSSNIKNDI